MSLYHQLETVEIPSISAFRGGSDQQDQELIRSPHQFAQPASTRLGNIDEFGAQKRTDEDPLITQKTQAAQVQAAIPVASVPQRVYGPSGDQTNRKKLVLEREDDGV